MNEDRYVIVYDSGDWVYDNETGDYMHLEECCDRLNDYEESMATVGGFIQTFDRLLDEAEKGE